MFSPLRERKKKKKKRLTKEHKGGEAQEENEDRRLQSASGQREHSMGRDTRYTAGDSASSGAERAGPLSRGLLRAGLLRLGFPQGRKKPPCKCLRPWPWAQGLSQETACYGSLIFFFFLRSSGKEAYFKEPAAKQPLRAAIFVSARQQTDFACPAGCFSLL